MCCVCDAGYVCAVFCACGLSVCNVCVMCVFCVCYAGVMSVLCVMRVCCVCVMHALCVCVCVFCVWDAPVVSLVYRGERPVQADGLLELLLFSSSAVAKLQTHQTEDSEPECVRLKQSLFTCISVTCPLIEFTLTITMQSLITSQSILANISGRSLQPRKYYFHK